MEHKISSPIPVKDAELLAYQARKVSAPEFVEFAEGSRSETSGRKRSGESTGKLSGTNKDTQSHVVQRKTSVSDLLSRLTMPTAASRSKMRDPASRSPSAGNTPLRSPKISSPRHFSNPSDMPKPPRSVSSSSSLAKGSRSPSSGSKTSQPFNRKPPSPPVEIRPPWSVSVKSKANDARPGQAHNKHNNKSNGHGIGHNDNTTTYGTVIDAYDPAHNGQHSVSDPLSPPGSRSASLGHVRRQSAPAPAQNMTSPRAMSRAAQPLHVDAPTKPPVVPQHLHSPTENELAAGLPAEQFSSSNSLATSQTFTVDSDTDLRHELIQLRELNHSLRDRNKQLRSRLDEALAIQDQLNVELSVSEAGRGSLQQQVNGYTTLQHEMERKSEKAQKKLQRSQKLVALLKFNIQDLKMTLEEKHLENYRLATKLKESGLELPDIDAKSEDAGR